MSADLLCSGNGHRGLRWSGADDPTSPASVPGTACDQQPFVRWCWWNEFQGFLRDPRERCNISRPSGSELTRAFADALMRRCHKDHLKQKDLAEKIATEQLRQRGGRYSRPTVAEM